MRLFSFLMVNGRGKIKLASTLYSDNVSPSEQINMMGIFLFRLLIELQIRIPVVRMEGAFITTTWDLFSFKLLSASFPVKVRLTIYSFFSKAALKIGTPENFPSMHNMVGFIS